MATRGSDPYTELAENGETSITGKKAQQLLEKHPNLGISGEIDPDSDYTLEVNVLASSFAYEIKDGDTTVDAGVLNGG